MHPGCWVGWYLPIVQNCGTSMYVGSMLHMCCIWVEQVGPDYPGDVLPVMSDMAIQDGSEFVGSPSTDGIGAEVPHMLNPYHWCHPQPAQSWDWWVANSFHAGSACTPPIPGAYHIDCYIGIGPPFHHILPVFPSVLYFMVALEGTDSD